MAYPDVWTIFDRAAREVGLDSMHLRPECAVWMQDMTEARYVSLVRIVSRLRSENKLTRDVQSHLKAADRKCVLEGAFVLPSELLKSFSDTLISDQSSSPEKLAVAELTLLMVEHLVTSMPRPSSYC